MEGNRGDKKGSKVPSVGSDWGVTNDRNPTETTSSPGHPGTLVSGSAELRMWKHGGSCERACAKCAGAQSRGEGGLGCERTRSKQVSRQRAKSCHLALAPHRLDCVLLWAPSVSRSGHKVHLGPAVVCGLRFLAAQSLLPGPSRAVLEDPLETGSVPWVSKATT